MVNRLKLIRIIRGKSQKEVALEVGLSPTMISNFENDLIKPTEGQKERLAGSLSVNVNDIFGLADVMEIRLVASRKRD